LLPLHLILSWNHDGNKLLMVFENGGTEVWELQGCSWSREHILQGFCSINKPLAVCFRCDSISSFFILKFPERRPKHCPLLDHCNIQQYGDPIEPCGLPQVACLDGVDGTRRALATVTTLGVSRLLRISAAAVCCCDGALLLNYTPNLHSCSLRPFPQSFEAQAHQYQTTWCSLHTLWARTPPCVLCTGGRPRCRHPPWRWHRSRGRASACWSLTAQSLLRALRQVPYSRLFECFLNQQSFLAALLLSASSSAMRFVISPPPPPPPPPRSRQWSTAFTLAASSPVITRCPIAQRSAPHPSDGPPGLVVAGTSWSLVFVQGEQLLECRHGRCEAFSSTRDFIPSLEPPTVLFLFFPPSLPSPTMAGPTGSWLHALMRQCRSRAAAPSLCLHCPAHRPSVRSARLTVGPSKRLRPTPTVACLAPLANGCKFLPLLPPLFPCSVSTVLHCSHQAVSQPSTRVALPPSTPCREVRV
jgi:hypothetical protein